MTDLLIKAGRIFDGEAEQPLERGFVAVADGRISAVGRQAELGDDEAGRFSRIEDLGEDATLLPGLINMHTHMSFSAGDSVFHDGVHDSNELRMVRAMNNLREALLCGTTTVRDCGTLNAVAFAMRDSVEQGLVPGPRIIASGNGITTTGGHCWFCCTQADSEEEVRKAVREQVKLGADFIKVFSTGGNTTPGSDPVQAQYGEAEMCAVGEEARRADRQLASHAHGTAGVRNSIAAGVTTIEHCTFLTPQGIHYEVELAQRIADAGIYVCPTIFRGISKVAGREDIKDSPQLKTFLSTLQQRYENLRGLIEQGVRIVSGTDAGVRQSGFGDYPVDLALMGDGAGLSPAYVLKTATSGAADCLGLSDLGRITPGKCADLLGVQGNPLASLADLRRTRLVVARGQVVN
ncbi:MAG: amidohydrolase family protein [SAR324 cluster bacterium]|nr:amidohydrolase family protein [SAR324 cluster bacterium]